jgi:hypothetical protein
MNAECGKLKELLKRCWRKHETVDIDQVDWRIPDVQSRSPLYAHTERGELELTGERDRDKPPVNFDV